MLVISAAPCYSSACNRCHCNGYLVPAGGSGKGKMSASSRIDLERFVPFRLNRLAVEVSRALAREYGERFAIDIPEWRIIATLGDRGRARAQDVALSTRMHKSVVSRAVARLIALGWVARSANARDRREAPLSLTAAGRRVY
ncbi:MAG: MarR family winged helix-turn-helix transcriptional regulator, partial [Geminicoccaceae bacterium]